MTCVLIKKKKLGTCFKEMHLWFFYQAEDVKRNAEIFEASLLSVHRAREDITWIRLWGTFQNAGASHTWDKRGWREEVCVYFPCPWWRVSWGHSLVCFGGFREPSWKLWQSVRVVSQDGGDKVESHLEVVQVWSGFKVPLWKKGRGNDSSFV